LQDLRERYREQLQAERAAGRLLQVVDLLFGRLEAAGIVREITGQARNRVYRVGKVLAAIEEPLEPAGQGR
jgi:hypothetical protein